MTGHDHMGVHEVAERLGTSRQWVHKLLARDDTFPRPVGDLKAGKVWHRDDIEEWITAHPRTKAR
jgi:predicted DNA-binding transcriptional regulator AlpA